jgi:hypothetical protein
MKNATTRSYSLAATFLVLCFGVGIARGQVPNFDKLPAANREILFVFEDLEYWRVGTPANCYNGRKLVVAKSVSQRATFEDQAASVTRAIEKLPAIAKRLETSLATQCEEGLSSIQLWFNDWANNAITGALLRKPFGTNVSLGGRGSSTIAYLIPQEAYDRHSDRTEIVTEVEKLRRDREQAESVGLAPYRFESCNKAKLWPRSANEPNARDICEAIVELNMSMSEYRLGTPGNVVCVQTRKWPSTLECSYTFTTQAQTPVVVSSSLSVLGVPEFISNPVGTANISSDGDAIRARAPRVFQLNRATSRWEVFLPYVDVQIPQIRTRMQVEEADRVERMRAAAEAQQESLQRQMKYDSCVGFGNPYSFETVARCGRGP